MLFSCIHINYLTAALLCMPTLTVRARILSLLRNTTIVQKNYSTFPIFSCYLLLQYFLFYTWNLFSKNLYSYIETPLLNSIILLGRRAGIHHFYCISSTSLFKLQHYPKNLFKKLFYRVVINMEKKKYI